VVELSEQTAELGLVGKLVLDADSGKSVEDSELLFAESLVDDQRVGIFAHAGGLHDEAGGVSRAQIGRSENDIRPIFPGERSEPSSHRGRLALTELRKRDIDIADVDVDHWLTCFYRGIPRDVARRFSVTDDVK